MGFISFPGQAQTTAVFEEQVSKAMTGLSRLGVGEADAVLLLLRNDSAFLQAATAISRLGASPVPLNWHYTTDELKLIIKNAGARLAIVHDDLAHLHAQAWSPALTLVGVDIADVSVFEPALRWSRLLAESPAYDGQRVAQRGALIYTSGTTSAPKAIDREALLGERLSAMMESQRRTYGFRSGMRALICGPLYHSMSMSYANTALATMGADGALFVEIRFDAQRVLELIQRQHITHLLMVPVMFVRLLRLDESQRRSFDLSSIECVTHSAAPCAPDIKRAMIDWWGPVLQEFYGASETGPVTMITSQEYLQRPGSVGRPLPDCRVAVLDEYGEPLPAGHTGEIAVRNKNYPDFTYRNLPAERAALDRDGLIATGDIGQLDPAGYLFLLDRKKDMVITGGVNVYPSEIESILLINTAVRDCAVFGIPDAEYGESLAAHIEPVPGAALDERSVIEFLRARLPSFKIPKLVRFGTLPRDDNGKIAKRCIADAYWEGAGRRI